MLHIQFYSIRVHLLYLELQMIGEVCLKFSVSSNDYMFQQMGSLHSSTTYAIYFAADSITIFNVIQPHIIVSATV